MYTLLSLLHAYSCACLYDVCLIAWLIIYLTACLHIWVNILLHASLHVSSSVFLVLKYFISVQNNLHEIMNYIIVPHVLFKFMSRFSFQVNYASLNVFDFLNTFKEFKDVACTKSVYTGLPSAEGQKLVCFKLTPNMFISAIKI